jgi:hypothetical protein
MVTEIGPAATPVTGAAHGSQTPAISKVQEASGNNLPQTKQVTAAQAAAQEAAASSNAATPPDLVSLVTLLNKYLNDSGQPYQYRVAPQSDNKLIQEINPANGQVLGEFSAAEFPKLAQSAGAPGLLIDDHA